MFCSLQTAIDALNRWKAEGTIIGVLFFGNADVGFLNFPSERYEVSERALVFYGPYNSAFSVWLPQSDDEEYFEFGVPMDSELDESYATYKSFAAVLRSKNVTCLQIWTASGCLLMYEVLGAMDAVATIQ